MQLEGCQSPAGVNCGSANLCTNSRRFLRQACMLLSTLRDSDAASVVHVYCMLSAARNLTSAFSYGTRTSICSSRNSTWAPLRKGCYQVGCFTVSLLFLSCFLSGKYQGTGHCVVRLTRVKPEIGRSSRQSQPASQYHKPCQSCPCMARPHILHDALTHTSAAKLVCVGVTVS